MRPYLEEKKRSTRVVGLFIIVFLSLLACKGERDQENVVTLRFSGTVRQLVMLSHYSGKVILVDLDPRFVVEVKIADEDTRRGIFDGAPTVAIAIHSPSRLFGWRAPDGPQDGVVGLKFEFSIERLTSAAGIRYRNLKCIGGGDPNKVVGPEK
jgi:hypothetical protein